MSQPTAVPAVKPPFIEGALALAAGQYYDEPGPKRLIVLHHTVSGTWPGTVKFWGSDAQRVGTAYGIDRDAGATVYRAFPDTCWAIHLFRRRAGGESGGNFTSAQVSELERASIGIELVSLGALEEKAGALLDAYGRKLGPTRLLVDGGQVIDLGEAWRGHRYFHAYTEAQVAQTIRLVKELCRVHGIPPVVPRGIGRAAGDPKQLATFAGVVTHAMLRPDKTDLHPAFPFDRLAYALGSPGW